MVVQLSVKTCNYKLQPDCHCQSHMLLLAITNKKFHFFCKINFVFVISTFRASMPIKSANFRYICLQLYISSTNLHHIRCRRHRRYQHYHHYILHHSLRLQKVKKIYNYIICLLYTSDAADE